MYVSILDIWLSVVGVAVLALVASGMIHVLFKYHNNENQRLAAVIVGASAGLRPVSGWTYCRSG